MRDLPLFAKKPTIPLAEELRPDEIGQVFGQEHLLAEGGEIQRMLASKRITSMVLWGPPGCGKTTLAKIIAKQSGYHFEILSAVTSGVADLKLVFAAASARQKQHVQTLLLVDEIHRFNRTQQDIFLPYIEDGTIVLMGATTENPSFELNSALLSRCKVVILRSLLPEALAKIMSRAEQICDRILPLTLEGREALIQMVDGDGRYLLSLCQELFDSNIADLGPAELGKFFQKRMPLYDKSRDGHYNLISALHKSLRGSDCDASLYWLARMLSGGEDPGFILRRLARFASEDIGLADPQSLAQVMAAKASYEFLGSPEGDLAISQAVVYLATAPKSNSCYKAHKAAANDAIKHGSLMPPKHILNAPTKFMSEQGYGNGYQYDHDLPEGFSGQNYFPENMPRQHYYQPVERGFEREITKRLHYWDSLRQKNQ